ncbi:PAS domain-containing protein [Sorangium sp. So ce1389]|uniref:PAS domain-containing protein n=1 Tax=Sorangium sp. So ce1389 TaxID=3133336 RepID=UPI003F63980C
MSTPLRVLLVEDSEQDARLILRELKRGSYEPSHERAHTPEGLSAALERQAYDVVLCDHSMPRFDSLSALRMVKERGLDLPFIIVSGSIGEMIVAEVMRAGAHDYVLKSDLRRLVPAIERSLRDVAERRERRRAEIALKESEERFALAVQGARDGLWDWNLTTGDAYYSERFMDILGCTDGALFSSTESFLSLVHEEDRQRVASALRGHLERGEPYDVEFRRRMDTGELRWICSRGQARWDEAGKATRMAGSLSDITARKQAEAALRDKLDIIERQQEAIRKLSTPIIEVWDGVITMPVFGAVDEHRAEQMMDVLLQAIVRTRCRAAIIDLTSADVIDHRTGDHIMKLIRAVELVGVRGIVVGIRPEVAQTIVSLGVDLSRIVTLANLRDALVHCMNGMKGVARRRPQR